MGEGFKTKDIVVTGASSGIGRGIALAFGREGVRVALLARREKKLDEVREEIRAAGGEAADYIQPEDVARAALLCASPTQTAAYKEIIVRPRRPIG